MFFVNHSMNFFVYIISGENFRREFVSMLGIKRPAVEPTNAESGAGKSVVTEIKVEEATIQTDDSGKESGVYIG